MNLTYEVDEPVKIASMDTIDGWDTEGSIPGQSNIKRVYMQSYKSETKMSFRREDIT